MNYRNKNIYNAKKSKKKSVNKKVKVRSKKCDLENNKLLKLLKKKGKLHLTYGNKKIPLNIGCPELI